MYNTICRTQTEDTCTYNRQTDGQSETDGQTDGRTYGQRANWNGQ